MRYFIQIVVGGVEPTIQGEYDTVGEQMKAMEALHRSGEISEEDSAFYLDIDSEGKPEFHEISSGDYDKWMGLYEEGE